MACIQLFKLKFGCIMIDCMLLLTQEMETQGASMSACINLVMIWLNGAIRKSSVPTSLGILVLGVSLLTYSHHCKRVLINSAGYSL